ncbi:tRNA (adenine(37)-N6)-methyltransferase isoform X1 [Erpetoichthys calabaricus]|uniref:tRNA (adenine(37)-N6)-methyltransferase isoform X1 n=1 Tax=Erpetoichthys calabaricus TaxID=27687 RepID=UPI0022344814|nr:tRNA (adenine(37)-N6)-methyltransferase isoform X1 [Erpetoichthys calabaricus]
MEVERDRSDEARDSTRRFQHQITVMRQEIQNLRSVNYRRKHMDSAVRAHKKSVHALQNLLGNISDNELPQHSQSPLVESSTAFSLEKGNIPTVPIGYIDSCFSSKNGTPRQPTICSLSRAKLQINRSVFNNPEHSLIGLHQYSHVWVIFVFHKNGHMNYKAKVKPPRLNGMKTGIFSTRSPHRPNAIGLTLAKLEQIKGDTIYLSGIDMIQGTPVLDIKPYIPEYDSPQLKSMDQLTKNVICQDFPLFPTFEGEFSESETEDNSVKRELTSSETPEGFLGASVYCSGESRSSRSEYEDQQCPVSSITCEAVSHLDTQPAAQISKENHLLSALLKIKDYLNESAASSKNEDAKAVVETDCSVGDALSEKSRTSSLEHAASEESASTTVASWVRESPVSSLEVRFTPHAENALSDFQPANKTGATHPRRPAFHYLRSLDEAKDAIKAVLSADPRSVYRRTRCLDQLFYFTLDGAHITCWFGEGFAEVVQIKPIQNHQEMPAM